MPTVALAASTTAKAAAAARAAAVEVIAMLRNRTQEKDVAESLLPTTISLRSLRSTSRLVIRMQLQLTSDIYASK